MDEKNILKIIYESFPNFRTWEEFTKGYDIDNLGLVLIALAKYSNFLFEKGELQELNEVTEKINSFLSSHDEDLETLVVTCYLEGALEHADLLSFLEKNLSEEGLESLKKIRAATN